MANIEPTIHPYAKTALKKFHLSADEKEVINRQALEIFTSATNGGLPFQEALAAILLSGITWGAQ